MKRIFLFWLSTLAALGSMAQDADHKFKVAKNLDVFNVIYRNLDLMYVDTLNADEVVGGAIAMMLNSLDPYTDYYPEEESKDLKELFTGRFAGIGSTIRENMKYNAVQIIDPSEGMPAALAGLKRGDLILSIDGKDMRGKDRNYVTKHLRGEAGSTFMLRIKRPSTGKEMDVKIKRAVIQQPAMPYYGMVAKGVGYVNLTQFTEGCAKEVRRAVIEMKQQGMDRMVLDLRGNGGGSEKEAVDIVNIFVPKGKTIVSNRGKQTRYNHTYATQVEPVDSMMPLVVLVNGSSASSSEITCGALQDLDRAVVMGTTTYGKGLVQTTTQLPYNGSLKFTVGRYYLPSGRCIQKLNYRHDNGGSHQQVAEAQRREFHTAAGRVVMDGAGVKPDVEVRADSLTNLAYYLMTLDSASIANDYIVDYISRHPTIAPPEEFELMDEDFAEFKQRVLDAGFNYDGETERFMESLLKIARFEGYYDDAAQELESLQRKLRHNVEKDLDFNKQTLKEMLAMDIIPAYYYQRGLIVYTLRHDPQMDAARELLDNLDKYNRLLQP